MAKATRQIAHDTDRAPQTFVSRQRAHQNSICRKNAQIKSQRIFIRIARKVKRLNCSHYTMWDEQKACHERHIRTHRQWLLPEIAIFGGRNATHCQIETRLSGAESKCVHIFIHDGRSDEQ